MRNRNIRVNLVYVILLHAVQFGNNWMKKFPRTAKLDEAVGHVMTFLPFKFFFLKHRKPSALVIKVSIAKI